MSHVLPTSILGRTAETVTKLGFGSMDLRASLGEPAIGALLNAVLDNGINIIDTSPDYGLSEEFIGKTIAHRRDEYFLASKCGCQIGSSSAPGGFMEHTYTRENVRAAVVQSLQRLRTDRLDLVQIHLSPSRQTLEDEDTVAELLAMRDEGKLRFIGMSGTLPEVVEHIEMGVFDVFQMPYSALEREHEELITRAAEAGAGVIVRGGVARGVPTSLPDRFLRLPDEMRDGMLRSIEDRKARWEEAERQLGELISDMGRMEFLLRFTLSHPSMNTTIVGTSNVDHLADNVAVASRGPLPADVYAAAISALDAIDT